MEGKRADTSVLSIHDKQVYVNRALAAGAKGYITKNSAPEILPEAIQCIQQGQLYVEQGGLTEVGEESGNYDYQTIIQTFSTREFDVF